MKSLLDYCISSLITLFLSIHVWGYSFESEFSRDVWITCTHDRTLNLDVSKMQIYFYDFKHNISSIYPISSAAENITNYQHWDPNRRLSVFIPGFKSDLEFITAVWMREAFRNIPEIYFIIIDFSAYTATRLSANAVERAVQYAYYIGRAGGMFLSELRNKGVSSRNIHISGHSFGAQLVGYVGETYISETGEKIWRITSIDPARPCFSDAHDEDKVRPGIAEYVEVYHCSYKLSATSSVLGDVDFFMNKELNVQPGCYENYPMEGLGNISADECGHIFCVKYYTDTLLRPDLYEACKPEAYVKNKCQGSEVAIAGYHNSGDPKGVWYTSTQNSKLNAHNHND